MIIVSNRRRQQLICAPLIWLSTIDVVISDLCLLEGNRLKILENKYVFRNDLCFWQIRGPPLINSHSKKTYKRNAQRLYFQQTNNSLKMNFSLRSVFITILFVLSTISVHGISMADGLTSGSILSSRGGELNPFFFGGGVYNNYVAYNPFAYSGFGKR